MNNNNDKRLQEHNRQKLRFRLSEGIKSAVLPPFLGLIPILTLTVLLFVGLSNRTLIFNISSSGMFYIVFDYIKIAALVSVYIAFLLALLVLLGTPHKWKTAESAALSAFKLQNTPSECPILISSKCVTYGRRRWEFFSMWVTMTDWKENIDRICHTFGEHLVGELSYGGNRKNNRQRIVFYTKSGAVSTKRGDLRDNEF